jgi:hypothetical protein
MKQWRAIIRDNHGATATVVVAATTPQQAHQKARDWFRRQAPRRTYIIEIDVERERPNS